MPQLHSRKVIKYFFLPINETITAKTKCQYMQEMHEKLHIQCPILVNRNDQFCYTIMSDLMLQESQS